MRWFHYNNFSLIKIIQLTVLIFFLVLIFIQNTQLQTEFLADKIYFEAPPEPTLELELKQKMTSLLADLNADKRPENLSYPNYQNAYWYIAQKGLVQFRKGNLPDLQLAENWEKHFMLGTYMGQRSDSIFETKSMSFLREPISYSDFISNQNQLQSMQVGMRNIAYSYAEQNKYSILVVFSENPLQHKIEKLNILKLKSNESKFYLSLQKALLISALFFIFVFLLHKTVLGFIIRKTFARQYALFYFSLLTLLGSFLVIQIKSIEKVKEFRIRQQLSQDFKSHLNKIEQNYAEFKRKLGKEISEALLNQQDTANQKLLTHMGSSSCLISEDRLSFSENAQKSNIIDFICINYGHQFYQLQFDHDPSQVSILEKNIKAKFPSPKKDIESEMFLKGVKDIFTRKESNDEIGLSKLIDPVTKDQIKTLDIGYNQLEYLWTRSSPGQPIKLAVTVLHKAEKSIPERYISEVKKELPEGWILSQSDQMISQNTEESEYIEELLSSRFFEKKLHYRIPKVLAYEEVIEFDDKIYIIVFVAFLIAILSWYKMSYDLTRPLQTILSGLSSIQRRQWKPIENIHKNEFGDVATHFNEMVEKLREKAELSSFVAEQILSLLSDQNGGLTDQMEDNAAVLFSDIRSFTTISEKHDPQNVVEMLNEYFEIWQVAVQKRGGVIERFIGDAVIVIFFERFSKQYHQDAVQCALDVMEQMPAFNNKRFNNNQFTVRNGVGISQGKIRFSVIGNHIKKHLFASGQAVIEAEELEAMSKNGSSSLIFVDESIHVHTQHSFDFVQFNHDGDRHKIYELKLESKPV